MAAKSGNDRAPSPQGVEERVPAVWKSVQAVASGRRSVSPVDARVYEDLTREALYELAIQRDITGRSSMRKTELIAALRARR